MARHAPGKGRQNFQKIDWAAELSRHDRWLRDVVWVRVREPQAVEEVLQEVSLAAIEQRAPLTDPASVAPWLYRLAIRHSLMYRRRAGRQRRMMKTYAEQLTSSNGRVQDPLAWLLQSERGDLIRKAIESLPRRDAEILLLKYGQKWSYRDLGQHLRISESAITARLHRARKRLRRELTHLSAIEGDS